MQGSSILVTHAAAPERLMELYSLSGQGEVYCRVDFGSNQMKLEVTRRARGFVCDSGCGHRL